MIDIELAIQLGIFIYIAYIRRTFVSGEVTGEAPAPGLIATGLEAGGGRRLGAIAGAALVGVAVPLAVISAWIFALGTPVMTLILAAVLATLALIMIGVSINASYLNFRGRTR